MINESELMLKVKSGELNYLADLFELNQRPLFNFFSRMGFNDVLSEDFTQETFIRVLAYRSSYKPQNTFRAWLYRIARNAVNDHFRKLSNQDIHVSFNEDLTTSKDTPTETNERNAKQCNFDKALSSLSMEQREIIILSRFQQFRHEEIAELLSCNINTLKTRIRAAVSSLKKQYELISGEVTS